MRKWFVAIFASALTGAGAPIGILGAGAADAPIQLPPVVVKESPIAPTAKPERLYTEEESREAIERTPGGVALIGSERIVESLGSNLKDILDFTPGVFVQPRQGGTTEESQFSIRGSGLRNNFHIRGINILQDGFTITISTAPLSPCVPRSPPMKPSNGLPTTTTPTSIIRWLSRSSTTSTTIGAPN